ncbi:hypothetical protein ABER90_10150 [Bacillus paranthracis]
MTKIPYVDAIGDSEIADLVKLSIDVSNKVTELENKMVTFIVKRFGLKTVSPKIEEWYLTSLEEFLKELKKQKVKLSQLEAFELNDLIEVKKEELKEIIRQWDSIHTKIDEKVTSLYGITVEEKNLIINSL